jgi:hypothetical protein
MSILLKSAVERTPDKGEVRIVVDANAGRVRLTITHGTGPVAPLDRALVRQLSRAMGMAVTEHHEKTTVELPAIATTTG